MLQQSWPSAYLVGKSVFLIGGLNFRASLGISEHCGAPAHKVTHLRGGRGGSNLYRMFHGCTWLKSYPPGSPGR